MYQRPEARRVGAVEPRHVRNFAPGVITLVDRLSACSAGLPARDHASARCLALSEKELVEAERLIVPATRDSCGSPSARNMIAPIIVYSTLTVATTSSWRPGFFPGMESTRPFSGGKPVLDGPQYYLTQLVADVWPGLAILLTTLSST